MGNEPWEGTSQERYEEELANYWPADGTESSSPKPNAELSQLRVLLEQNEGKAPLKRLSLFYQHIFV